jgi:hypothetical protein
MWVRVAALGLVGCGHEVAGLHTRHHLLQLFGREQASVDPEATLQLQVGLEAGLVLGSGYCDPPGLLKTTLSANPVVELLEDSQAVECHSCGEFVGVVLSDDRRGSSGPTGADGVLLEYRYVEPALSKVKRHAAAHDPRTNYHGIGSLGHMVDSL